MIKPCLSEQARTLVSRGRVGMLATQSLAYPGFPFGSLMPYAADERGSPVFFISSLALHTRNLHENRHASLFITEPQAMGDPLAQPRVTLVGLVEQVDATDASGFYLEQHPNAKQWQDFSDFCYFRMNVSAAYCIAGFGQMGWIAAEEYRNACPTT